MIGEAGWNPPQPTVPPGLEGWSSSPDRSAEGQELVRSLWESAEEDQKKVLEKLGLMPKPQPKTSLRDLCKLHAPDLPKEIQDLLEEPPRPKPTARQAVEAANKQFKEATAKLREAIARKAIFRARWTRSRSSIQAYSGSSKKRMRRSGRCNNLSRASRQRSRRQ